jgi:hypothetical protein
MACSGSTGKAGESREYLTVVAIWMTLMRYAPARELAKYLAMVS